MNDPTRTETPRRQGRAPLAGLALCALLPALGVSIANVGLPSLGAALGASFQQLQWVVLAYLLASTTLVVSAGRLGDLYGPRRLLLVGIALFTLASGLCAAAPSLGWLIAARALQGLGAALLMALSLALVGAAVPKERSGRAMGLLATLSALGTALGPALGGLLVAQFGWPALFLVKLPLGLLAFGLAWRFLPRDGVAPPAPRFDALGALLLALTLAAYALALTLGRGQPGRVNLALLGAAGLGLLLFGWVEQRVAAPLLPLAALREGRLGAGLLAGAGVAMVLMATLVVGPFHLAQGLGLAPAAVGLVMAAGPATVAALGLLAGRGVDRFGAPRMRRWGLAGMLLGSSGLALAPLALGVPGYLGPLVLLTASYALFQAANQTALMAGLPAARRGLVAGLLNLARHLGLISGAAALGAVFAIGAGTADLARASATAVASGTRASFALAAGLVLLLLLGALREARSPRLGRRPSPSAPA